MRGGREPYYKKLLSNLLNANRVSRLVPRRFFYGRDNNNILKYFYKKDNNIFL